MLELPKSDLEEIAYRLENIWCELRNSTILILGGTGFVGTWITSSLIFANKNFGLNLKLIILTRSSKMAILKNTYMKSSIVRIIQHDLTSEIGKKIDIDFDFFIHGATDSTFINSNFIANPQSSIYGARFILNNVNPNKLVRGIHLSSGAVYPAQMKEDMGQLEMEIPDNFVNSSEYGKAKIETELLLKEHSLEDTFEIANPRLFSFYGPGIPLDRHFAIGNFVRNALSKESILINGNPNTVRSYMYPTDLVVWTIKLLLKPTRYPLNFGSEIPIKMKSLADEIGKITGDEKIEIRQSNSPVSIYFPSTTNARKYLNEDQSVTFEQGLERWVNWLQR
jgi:dTDP-glucose 4,6-dehydratase